MPAPPPSLAPSAAPSVPATPAGFLRPADGETAELSWDGRRWLAAGEPIGDHPDGPDVLDVLDGPGHPDRPDRTVTAVTVDAADVARLRPLRGLAVRWPTSRVPSGVVTALAAAGVPLYAETSPGWADPVLARLLAAWTPEQDTGGPRSVTALRREEQSVRLRRHGLRDHAGAGGPSAAEPEVSVVMASRRPHLLGFALGQIARQRRVRVEVLLGLHGVPADDERVRRAVGECGLPVTVVEASREIPFGQVLNLAASRAGGDHLAKWDDDDWYGPEHLADLLLARSYSGAEIVGTAAEFFHLEPLNATIRRTDYSSEVWSEHVAGGTILIRRDDLADLGGFPPLPRAVDAGLLKAAHAAGARAYRTHGLGYVLRRTIEAEHTWRLPLAHFLRVASNQWRGFRPSLILETP
ncbi:family 2 glycosyl transferase [Streptosporangium sp. DT93]|uniref:glycosyltransferase family 2 protein n=1 Tax=Streptosporangium sp. DT93 TaxID=3393428 RepID=UPI003CE76BF5